VAAYEWSVRARYVVVVHDSNFNRRNLVSMIRHQQGVLLMVAELFATPRAAQDVKVSVFANDVESMQTAEIALVRQMLMEM